MSKYDQYVREYLLKNGELSIEKIGSFFTPAGAAGEKSLQLQHISFSYNKRVQTSEGLIGYIAAQTGKNKVLIASDLSSVFEEARQYANLGKAFLLAGLGNISLNRQGEYEFATVQEHTHNTESSYASPHITETGDKGQAGRNAVVLIAFIIILLLAGAAGWGIYKYFSQAKPNKPVTAAMPDTTATDTNKKVAVAADTSVPV
ncbi:MAG TPA: hypothetical protein VHB48_04760, partial [Chitinophagaceae bacterium]|nr:hypothetical protein [Chitinophagaceae bacterium]